MENRSRIAVLAIIGVLAILGGFAAGALLTRSPGSAGSTPSAQATATPGDTATTGASAEPTTEPTDTSSPEDSASASPSSSPIPDATITFTQLRVDAANDPAGADRVITWTSTTGAVKAEIRSVTPMGDLKMCLKTATKVLGCRTAGSGTLSAKTTKPKETFILTLRGDGIAQPVVDVTLTFPAAAPQVTIENARFDGTAFPATNGIQAIVTPRADGTVGLKAEWGGHPFTYEIDAIEQGGSGSQTSKPDTGSVGADVQFDVTATNPWKIVVQNTEDGFGITPMTATISWP